MTKVLIIEDDDVIAQGMARHLQSAGFDAVGVANGETGLARLRFERPDVCVLDLMLPGLDGWKVIEQARGEGIGTPIVVVSARGTEHDRVHALEIGADDYLVKPFSMKELDARVGAAARRGTRAQDPRRGDEIVIEELRLDTKNVQAYVDDKSADLTPDRVPAPLRARARDGPRAHPRRAAPAGLGPPRLAPRPHGRRLRPQAAREDRPPRPRAHTFLQTRYGVGYKLEPELKAEQPGSANAVDVTRRHARHFVSSTRLVSCRDPCSGRRLASAPWAIPVGCRPEGDTPSLPGDVETILSTACCTATTRGAV